MNRKVSFVVYIVLAVVSAILLIMTVIASITGKEIFNSMFTVVLLSIFALAIAVSVIAFNPKKKLYSVGFYMMHIGMVLFLVGVFVYCVGGQKVAGAFPVNPNKTYNRMGTEQSYVDLGIEIGVSDAKEEMYEDGNPKYYEATLILAQGNNPTETEKVTVNHPVRYGGWKIYLMGIGENITGETGVTLLLKKDKAEYVSTSGIVLIIIGTFVMCFLKPRERTNGKLKDNPHRKMKKEGGFR